MMTPQQMRVIAAHQIADKLDRAHHRRLARRSPASSVRAIALRSAAGALHQAGAWMSNAGTRLARRAPQPVQRQPTR